MRQLKLSIDSAGQAKQARQRPPAPKSKSIQKPRGVRNPIDTKQTELEDQRRHQPKLTCREPLNASKNTTAPPIQEEERGGVTTVLHRQGKDTKILLNHTPKANFRGM
jgi:hypothetical protein